MKMQGQYPLYFRLTGWVCVLALINLLFLQSAFNITNNGHQGTTISGRPSVAIVRGPGGTRVNTFLGTMFLPRRDLRVLGRGLPIEIDLTYNSNRGALTGPFGFGW